MRLPLFVGTRFQGLFHFPFGDLFTFPSRYLFTIGRQVVLRLGRWSSQIPSGFHVPQGTQESARRSQAFVYGSLTLYAAVSHRLPLAIQLPHCGPTTPAEHAPLVWPIPRSLATTEGVSIDFLSYRYLDVSVPCVGSDFSVITYYSDRVSPFGHFRIIARLPAPRNLSQAPTSFIAS